MLVPLPARSCTSTWTRSTRPSSSATVRSCAASPVIVGADPQGGRGRGVVSTASYEARRFGVGSAMPISQAYRLCPQGVYVPRRHGQVRWRVSKEVMEILRRVTDLVEPVSIDEAFLDVTGSRAGVGRRRRRSPAAEGRDPGRAAAHRLGRRRLVEARGEDRVRPAEARRPRRRAAGDGGGVPRAAAGAPALGRRAEDGGAAREARASHTIGDLAALEPARLARRLGTHGQDLQRLARGEDDRPVVAEPAEREEPRPGAHVRPDTADAARLRRDAAVAGRRRRGAAARPRPARRARSRSSTATRTSRRRPTPARCASRRTPAASSSTSPGALRRRPPARPARAPPRDLRLALRRGARAARPLRRSAEPAPLDRVRDAIAKRFGDEAITRASLLGRLERRNPSDKPPR